MTVQINGLNGVTFPNNSTQASAGQVLQVVNASYATQTSSSSQTYVDTGLSATITPKFSTSKIVILVEHPNCIKDNSNSQNDISMNICRNGSQIVQIAHAIGYNGVVGYNYFGMSGSYVDSPATTSATTYKTQFKNQDNNGGTVYTQTGGVASTMILMEIAA